MLKYFCQINTIQDNNTSPPPPTENQNICFLINLSFSSYISENISVPRIWKRVRASIMFHFVMSLSIIGHVNIQQYYSGKIFLWQQIRLHYNKDNLKEPHPLWGWGRGWLVGWVNLNLQIKAAFCNVDVPTNNREKGKERSIWTVSQPSDWGCTWW